MWIAGQNNLLLNTDYIQKIDLVNGPQQYKIVATMHNDTDIVIGTIKTKNAADGLMKSLRNELGLKLFNDQSQAN